MASPTRWTWVWVKSGSWWWTGRPGVLRFMGSQSWTRLSDWTELMQYYSLQHLTVLPSPITFATGCCFCFGSISSFFLELFLHWYPVAYWVPTDLGSSSFTVPSFCLFTLFMGFLRQEYWSGLPFPSPVDYILSELFTLTVGLGWPYMEWLIVSLS